MVISSMPLKLIGAMTGIIRRTTSMSQSAIVESLWKVAELLVALLKMKTPIQFSIVQYTESNF